MLSCNHLQGVHQSILGCEPHPRVSFGVGKNSRWSHLCHPVLPAALLFKHSNISGKQLSRGVPATPPLFSTQPEVLGALSLLSQKPHLVSPCTPQQEVISPVLSSCYLLHSLLPPSPEGSCRCLNPHTWALTSMTWCPLACLVHSHSTRS